MPRYRNLFASPLCSPTSGGGGVPINAPPSVNKDCMCTVVAPRKRGDIRFVREMESQIIKIFFLPPAKLVETDTRAQKRNIYIYIFASLDL